MHACMQARVCVHACLCARIRTGWSGCGDRWLGIVTVGTTDLADEIGTVVQRLDLDLEQLDRFGLPKMKKMQCRVHMCTSDTFTSTRTQTHEHTQARTSTRQSEHTHAHASLHTRNKDGHNCRRGTRKGRHAEVGSDTDGSAATHCRHLRCNLLGHPCDLPLLRATPPYATPP